MAGRTLVVDDDRRQCPGAQHTTIQAAVAAVRAPATPGLLNIRGGSSRETEASRAEALLNSRFSRPIGEYYAVTVQGPVPLDSGMGRQVLDSLVASVERQRYVRGVISFGGTGDST